MTTLSQDATRPAEAAEQTAERTAERTPREPVLAVRDVRIHDRAA